MSFINSYRPPQPRVLTEPDAGLFDAIFNARVPETLESARVRLVPFVPSIHAKAFYDEYSKDIESIEAYIPVTWPTYSVFLTWMTHNIFADSQSLPFAIIDRTKGNDGADVEESIAGMIGYMHSSPDNLSVEVAPVMVLPRAQRTFVSSNAIGLLLKYALDTPEQGGLGLRRVYWQANPGNQASVRAAERMRLKIEGVSRWTYVLPLGRDGGLPPVDGRRGDGQGRHSTILSICWDDWEDAGREHIDRMMAREG